METLHQVVLTRLKEKLSPQYCEWNMRIKKRNDTLMTVELLETELGAGLRVSERGCGELNTQVLEKHKQTSCLTGFNMLCHHYYVPAIQPVSGIVV